jgi:hypothetical protein
MPALCPIWLSSVHWKPCAFDSDPQVRFISFVDLQGMGSTACKTKLLGQTALRRGDSWLKIGVWRSLGKGVLRRCVNVLPRGADGNESTRISMRFTVPWSTHREDFPYVLDRNRVFLILIIRWSYRSMITY